MQQLYFIRHGESVLNAQRIFAGQTDTPLTDKGRAQAQEAGQQAKSLSFGVIVSSPLSRALETAQIVATQIDYPIDTIMVNDIFKERSLGKLEGTSWDQYNEQADATNGAETDEQLLTRAQAGLAWLQTLEQPIILLVGHGSFSRALRTAIDPTKQYGELENATIMRLL